MTQMEEEDNKETPEIKRDTTPENSPRQRRGLQYALSDLKVKTKPKNKIDFRKNLFKMNSLQASDYSDISGNTPGVSTNISNNNPSNNISIISPKKKRKKRVRFALDYKLVNYIYFNPKDPVEDNGKEEEEEKQKKEEKNETEELKEFYETDKRGRVTVKEQLQCCIIF